MVNIFFILFFTCITGSIFTVVWMAVKKTLENNGNGKEIYGMLRLAMLGYMVPIAYILLKFEYSYMSGWGFSTGYLFVVTPTIILFSKWAVAIWLGGTGVCLVVHLLNGCKFVRRNSMRMTATKEQRRILERICAEMGIGKEVKLYQSYHLPSPCISGWRRPKLYLPPKKDVREPYTEEELDMIFRHELAHFMQKDTFWKPVFTFVRYLHWFNPLVIWTYREMNRWAELCCDEACCEKHPAKWYYYTIISLMPEKIHNVTGFIPTWFESKAELEWRIEHMKYSIKYKGRKVKRIKRVAAVMLIAAGIVSAAGVNMKASDLYDHIYLKTDEGIEVEMSGIPANTLQEHIAAEDEFAGMTVEEEPESEEWTTFSTAGIDWTVKNNVVKQTAKFKKNKGETIHVFVGIEPEDKYVKVGVEQPNGLKIYVTGTEFIEHTFNVTETGYYRVFVSNSSGKTVHVVGAYRK